MGTPQPSNLKESPTTNTQKKIRLKLEKNSKTCKTMKGGHTMAFQPKRILEKPHSMLLQCFAFTKRGNEKRQRKREVEERK